MANQTRQLAQLLSEDGCDVTLVQTNVPYRPAAIERLPGVRAIFRLLPYLRRLWVAIGGSELVHVMANSGWAWHLFAAPAVWIARMRGVPAVVNYRGGDADRFLTREMGLVRPTLLRAAAIAVPSGFLQTVFAKHGVATTIVPNIVRLDAFRPAASLEAHTNLLVARNLEAIYDIATAIRAFAIVAARCPDASFTGQLDNAELPKLYRSSAIVLNPSQVDNLPISLLEALACGVPIVSTNVGGVPYMVEHETNALLVPPGSPEAMAAAVLRLIDDRLLAERLRLAGMTAARRYSWSAVRSELYALYARVLGDASAHRDANAAPVR